MDAGPATDAEWVTSLSPPALVRIGVRTGDVTHAAAAEAAAPVAPAVPGAARIGATEPVRAGRVVRGFFIQRVDPDRERDEKRGGGRC